MVRVKICGITTEDGFDSVVAGGADWIGWNFIAASPRCVSASRAAALSARSAGGPKRVGLFMAPSDAEIAAVLAEIRLDVLQIYADAARAAALRTTFGIPVWRAVGVSDARDLPAQAGGVDGFLIEAKPPPGATRPGGNAVSFDWSIMQGWAAPCDWVLAGGLSPANVAAAVRATGTTAVDVSSGVERQPGIKDPERVRAFIAAARAA